MKLLKGKETYTLYNVLLVTDLAYNLLSITSAAKKGEVTTYTETRCEIRDTNSSLWIQRRKSVLPSPMRSRSPSLSKLQSQQLQENDLASTVWSLGNSRNANPDKKQNGQWNRSRMERGYWLLRVLCGGEKSQVAIPAFQWEKSRSSTRADTQ